MELVVLYHKTGAVGRQFCSPFLECKPGDLVPGNTGMGWVSRYGWNSGLAMAQSLCSCRSQLPSTHSARCDRSHDINESYMFTRHPSPHRVAGPVPRWLRRREARSQRSSLARCGLRSRVEGKLGAPVALRPRGLREGGRPCGACGAEGYSARKKPGAANSWGARAPRPEWRLRCLGEGSSRK